MLGKFMSRIGFGNVVVNTILNQKRYARGDTVSGKVEITGGISDQEMKGIILTLIIKYEQDKEDSDFSHHEKEVKEIILTDIDHVQSNEKITIPFHFPISADHLKSGEGVETVVRTKLLVEYGVDAHDEDEIIIV
ncbi:MAG: sporulation protein [Bacillus sp. (in: firmicutes)]